MRKPKVTVIGGGTGISVILDSLRKKPVDITAIVTVADDGGSSGELRKNIQKLTPPGDLRNVLVAMSDMPRFYEKVFQYRFADDDGPLAGHPLGNLIIAGISEMQGSTYNAMQLLTKGYHEDPEAVLRSAMFQEEDYKQMVIVKDIDFFSLCEHHMLPFYGKAHVAYIPNGYITGLSKIARVVDVFSHRLQVQERMTLQIKECIQETLNPLGVMVVVEAKHMCMQMRGVEKQNAITTTSDFTGAFNQAKTREEFMNLIRHNR